MQCYAPKVLTDVPVDATNFVSIICIQYDWADNVAAASHGSHNTVSALKANNCWAMHEL